MRSVKNLLLVLLLGLGVQTMLFAQTLSDIAKEGRWKEQIIDTLFDGETVSLEADGHDFLGIEMESVDGHTGRAAIVVHGIGVHPNWEQVIRPLRVGLTEFGWHTLSIQMPILPNEATGLEYVPLFDEVTGRFEAAIDFLQSRGHREIVIVAHSMGSSMTMRYMADVGEPPVMALVLVGMQGGRENMVNDNVSALKKVKLPVLEMYGGNDLPGVVDFAARKASAAHTGGNRAYRQIMVDGANHFFDDLDETLVETVGEWLAGLESS